MRGLFSLGSPIREPDNVGNCNSVEGFLLRAGSRCLEATATITGNNETVTTNVFQFTGPVRILEQFAVITDTTALTNATNIYADIWDGTTATDLTADGMTLSGASVGTFFTKDKTSDQAYSLLLSDQGRLLETLFTNKAGRPFTINGKNGVTNYIRFHVTTNTTLNFSMFVHFEYELINGATLAFV
jgi:hypothetical protein